MKKKQRITLGVSALILLVLGFWINSRWHVWFGNPEEPAYLPLSTPGAEFNLQMQQNSD